MPTRRSEGGWRIEHLLLARLDGSEVLLGFRISIDINVKNYLFIGSSCKRPLHIMPT